MFILAGALAASGWLRRFARFLAQPTLNHQKSPTLKLRSSRHDCAASRSQARKLAIFELLVATRNRKPARPERDVSRRAWSRGPLGLQLTKTSSRRSFSANRQSLSLTQKLHSPPGARTATRISR